MEFQYFIMTRARQNSENFVAVFIGWSEAGVGAAKVWLLLLRFDKRRHFFQIHTDKRLKFQEIRNESAVFHLIKILPMEMTSILLN